MKETWSSQAWDYTQDVYDQIIAHPFLQDLMNGALDKKRFEQYIQQDALYLADYAKALNQIAARLGNPAYKELFKRFAADSVACEQYLHEGFMERFAMAPQKRKSASCERYTSFLLDCTANRTLGEALASVLPCFWVYNEAGKYLCAHQTKAENPYQAWIDMYAGEAFDGDVHSYLAICNEYAEAHPEERAAMKEAFAVAVRAEYDFWDSAYQLKME